MVSSISGSNLNYNVKELYSTTPQPQNSALAQSNQASTQTVNKAKTDTVSFSPEALAMAKGAEKPAEESSEGNAGQAAERLQGRR